MAKKKRTLLDSSKIEEVINSGMSFVQINNRIFDDFYSKEQLTYHPRIEKRKGEGAICIDNENTTTTTMNDLDMIVFIFLNFLSINKITLKTIEMASFLRCSEKRLKDSLEKLRMLEGVVNSRYNVHAEGERELIPSGNRVPLIIEKAGQGYDNGKLKRLPEWYIEFCPNYKRSKDTYIPINFFAVSLQDLKLLLNDYLTRQEFIFYLFIIRADTDQEGKKPVYWSNSKLGERLRIKGTDTTINAYVDKLLNLGLIEVNQPKNYEENIVKRQEPSRQFIPIISRRLNAEYRASLESDSIDDDFPVEAATEDIFDECPISWT